MDLKYHGLDHIYNCSQLERWIKPYNWTYQTRKEKECSSNEIKIILDAQKCGYASSIRKQEKGCNTNGDYNRREEEISKAKMRKRISKVYNSAWRDTN